MLCLVFWDVIELNFRELMQVGELDNLLIKIVIFVTMGVVSFAKIWALC